MSIKTKDTKIFLHKKSCVNHSLNKDATLSGRQLPPFLRMTEYLGHQPSLDYFVIIGSGFVLYSVIFTQLSCLPSSAYNRIEIDCMSHRWCQGDVPRA